MGGEGREGGRQDTQGVWSQDKQEINFVTLQNFSQQKKHTEVGTTKEGGGNREYKVRKAGDSGAAVLSQIISMLYTCCVSFIIYGILIAKALSIFRVLF